MLDALFHVPAALGRQLATVDRLSHGRLLVGLGQGWSTEEFQTAGIPMSRRGHGFEDFIAALQATWRPDPVQYQGRFYQIPPSEVGPKPVQAGGPQILIGTMPGAVAPAQRAGRLGLGFNPVILDWDSFATQLRAYQEAAGATPGPVVVRVNGPVTAEPLGAGRTPLTGSVEEVPEPEQARQRLLQRNYRPGRGTRQLATGITATAAAAAVLGLGLTGAFGPARGTGTIRTAAFTLVEYANGTATLTIRPGSVLNPGILQNDLRHFGIPAIVTTGSFCSSDPAPPASGRS